MKKKIFGIIAAILIVLFGLCMCSSEPADTNPYDVKVSKEAVTSDWGGDKVLIVNYEWTNCDPNSASLASIYKIKAYQDGIELSEAFLIDGNWNFDGYYNEIKPDATQTFQRAYELNNKSEVTIEFYDMWNSNPVISQTISIE